MDFKKENIDMMQNIEINLLKVDKKCSSLLARTNKHLHHLAELIEDPFKYDSHQFRTEHETLEDEFVQFLKDFRKNRKEVFTITEHIVAGEELVRQLNLVPK